MSTILECQEVQDESHKKFAWYQKNAVDVFEAVPRMVSPGENLRYSPGVHQKTLCLCYCLHSLKMNDVGLNTKETVASLEIVLPHHLDLSALMKDKEVVQ